MFNVQVILCYALMVNGLNYTIFEKKVVHFISKQTSLSKRKYACDFTHQDNACKRKGLENMKMNKEFYLIIFLSNTAKNGS